MHANGKPSLLIRVHPRHPQLNLFLVSSSAGYGRIPTLDSRSMSRGRKTMRSSTRPSSRLASIAFAALLLTATAARAADGVAPNLATFEPGKEIKIADPQTGGLGWYVVYT